MGERIFHFEADVIIEPDGDGFHAYCPALKGLHTSGDTQQEALRNAKDAVEAYLLSLIKHHDPIPIGVRPEKKRPWWRVSLRPRGRIRQRIKDLVVPVT